MRILLLALLLLLFLAPGGSAMDHDALDKVLKAMPPNGPFSRFGDVTMYGKSRPAGLAPVVFPHWSHRARFTCRVCHQELAFSMRQGDTGITRKKYLEGKFCGACHNGTLAFAVQDGPQAGCRKCHMEKENRNELDRKFEQFAELLPMSRFGNGIDWAKALQEGKVDPIDTLNTDQPPLPFPEKLKQPLKLGTSSPRSDVSFSHREHFAELDCSSCHPEIFNIKKKSTADFTMEMNIYGAFCGACHMKVAFPMNDCKRCHNSMSNRSF